MAQKLNDIKFVITNMTNITAMITNCMAIA
jgi:hypothetical protein